MSGATFIAVLLRAPQLASGVEFPARSLPPSRMITGVIFMPPVPPVPAPAVPPVPPAPLAPPLPPVPAAPAGDTDPAGL